MRTHGEEELITTHIRSAMFHQGFGWDSDIMYPGSTTKSVFLATGEWVICSALFLSTCWQQFLVVRVGVDPARKL
jgi:hypothetical protein